MNIGIYSEKNDLSSILLVSFIFHFAVIAAFAIAVWLRPAKKDPPPIPFFEMINVAPPPSAPPAPKTKRVEKPAPPEPVQPEPKSVQKPEPKPDLKQEPKLAQKPEPKPAPAPAEPTPVAPSMDMPMDMPTDIKTKDTMDIALRIDGNITMDSQLKEYLDRLVRLIYRNFNPPSGTEISKGTKSTVQVRISRSGEISEVFLRTPSSNSIWDRLAVRAVQITKPPPLPPSYTEENLPLFFDFMEK